MREYTKSCRIFTTVEDLQPDKADMHALICFFDLKLFLEDLRTNSELFMRSLSWLKISWELKDPQHRTWPTTEVTRDSRGSCSSSIMQGPAKWSGRSERHSAVSLSRPC